MKYFGLEKVAISEYFYFNHQEKSIIINNMFGGNNYLLS